MGCLALVGLFLIALMLHPKIIFAESFWVGCVYVVVDAFAFIIGYSILQKLNTLIFWKFLAYLLVIVSGSLVMNFLLSGMLYKSMLLFLCVVFTLFNFLNFAFWKTLFHTNFRQAFLVSMLLSLVNSLICFMGTTVRM